MDLPPLPAPFAWRPDDDGLALLYRGSPIALTANLPNGWARCARRIGTVDASTTFLPSPDHAARFLGAWATKWEREIVGLYDSQPRSTYQAMTPEPRTNEPEVYVPRRKPRRRRD